VLIWRWLKKLLPHDEEPGCGYGPFKFRGDHPFNRACNLHDYGFDDAADGDGKTDKTLDELDWDLFWRWVLIARAETDYRKRLYLVCDIIYAWPLARLGGKVLYDD
jgi:hypothetical protein